MEAKREKSIFYFHVIGQIHYNYDPEVRKCFFTSFTVIHIHKAVDQTVDYEVRLLPILMWAEPSWLPELPQTDGLFFPSTFGISQNCVKPAEPYSERSLQNVVFSFPTPTNRRGFTWSLRKANSIIQHNSLPQAGSEFSL